MTIALDHWPLMQSFMDFDSLTTATPSTRSFISSSEHASSSISALKLNASTYAPGNEPVKVSLQEPCFLLAIPSDGSPTPSFEPDHLLALCFFPILPFPHKTSQRTHTSQREFFSKLFIIIFFNLKKLHPLVIFSFLQKGFYRSPHL